ncbi:MAG: DUF1365 domain-containing protein [Verrucomicrobiota bacterium]
MKQPSPRLNSCLYECEVMHHRLLPKEHQFQYRIFMFALDLDEIDTVASRVLGFSHNRFNLYTFKDSDHLPCTGGRVKENLRNYLREQGVLLPEKGRVVLLTLPRVLGYIFNPVSFYFCFDEAEEPLCAVAEVGNTFGEMKPFLLQNFSPEYGFHLVAPKHFYVSPFSGLEIAFDFKLRVPGEHLEIHINDRAGDQITLLSALTGRRLALGSATLLWLTFKYPLITVRVIFLIHLHALFLWAKGLPYFAKSDRADLQKDVLRPHRSLAAKNHE